ncbi:SMP-30/gluconolactonase/LRE family protein [Aspergillus novofumigatus IBT 16806]|uniref:Calcium-dependent phosphotriesterase n=1 Tax=Aspergillus novofumigatus (strain IBT 16806) TaxID=1392255 RepID=A0A2I1BXT4_ASPN1|nr:calcium-dependent phosphotriesterase [Aspergillus novofumigatus IBT 16806]PKX90194.1 calcium-dependent phosphotriesterase [Aspergillus novofumigatus IBT 16806]
MAGSQDQVAFVEHQEEFDAILGPDPHVSILADESSAGFPLYHEACVYHAPTRSIFVTSNQIPNPPNQQNLATGDKHIKLSRVYDTYQRSPTESNVAKIEDITFPRIDGAMLNGGVNSADGILFCAQGSKDPSDPSGIIKVAVPSEGSSVTTSEIVIGSFHGIPFNSVNDVVVHSLDSSIWFTDPQYGFHQGIRPQPQLPNQVYRYDPRNGSIRAVADGFVRPNGLCFSPGLDTLYVTDTGAIHGSPSVPNDPAGPSHIYAFDIVYPKGRTEPMLVNRPPDGIKCDTRGNVYAGCGDGIEVWNPSGVLIGTIKIAGGVANFCFGENGVIYACNETRLLRIHLGGEGAKGALLGI